MEMHINEIVAGDVLVKDIFSKTGLLLLKTGAVITKAYKELLKNHSVVTITVARTGGLA